MNKLVPMCRRCVETFQDEVPNVLVLKDAACISCGQDAEVAVNPSEVPLGASLCLVRGFHVAWLHKPCRDCGEKSPEAEAYKKRAPIPKPEPVAPPQRKKKA